MAVRTGVLLLHGLTGMPSEMRPVEKYLQRLGFETEAALLAGHGGTHKELIAASWKDWIESAAVALQRLLERCDQAVICGLSMGASIASILAGRESRVAGVIMLSPTLSFDGSNLDNISHQKTWKSKFMRDVAHAACMILPVLGETFYWTETPPYGLKDERLQRQITRSIEAARRGENTEFGLFRTYFASLCQMNLVTDEFRRTASKVTCPVLIVSSLEDTLAQLYNATDTYDLMGSQDKVLVMLTGCDHVVTLDLMRHYVLSQVGQFMERLTGIKDTIARQNISSGVTVELHNDLPQAKPYARSRGPAAPASELQRFIERSNLEAVKYYSLVARFNGEQLFVLPFLAARYRLANNLPGLFGRLCGIFEDVLPGLLRPRLFCVGISEDRWAEVEAAVPCSQADMRRAWLHLLAIVATLSNSLDCQATAFVDLGSSTLEPASRRFPCRNPVLSFLLRRISELNLALNLRQLEAVVANCQEQSPADITHPAEPVASS